MPQLNEVVESAAVGVPGEEDVVGVNAGDVGSRVNATDAMPLAGRAIRFPTVVYTSTPLIPLHAPRHETVR